MIVATVLACDTPVDPIERPLPTSCQDPGGIDHGGRVSGTWRAADGPHRIAGGVHVDGPLRVEAGALVCLMAEAVVTVTGSLHAEGEADAVVIFTAADPAAPWGEIHGAGSISLAETRIEHARRGVRGEPGSEVSIARSVIRRIDGPGLVVGTAGSFVEAVIDSACLAACGPDDAALVVRPGAAFSFSDGEILGSGADGMRIGSRSQVALLGGRIEGSAGTGLHIEAVTGRPVVLTGASPIRITGGARYPASLPLSLADDLLGTADAQQRWTGNAMDTVLVSGESGGADAVTVRPGLAWAISGSLTGGPAHIARLELEPGGVLKISSPAPTHGLTVGRIVSRGTAEGPAEIRARLLAGQAPALLALAGAPAEPSTFAHTRITGVQVDVRDDDPAVFEDVVVRDGAVRLAAAGSRMTRTRILAGGQDPYAAALTIAARDIRVTRCEIRGSDRDGVLVEVADDVRINECNILGNAGAGVRSTAAGTLDARDNWWGDAAGPHGPDGDGIVGAIDYEPFRTEPVAIDG